MLIEKFVDSVSSSEEKDNHHHWYNHLGPLLFIIVIKLVLIYLVMVLWPKVMPKVFPSVNKNPGYINLIGLSVILSLI
jgi:flagellar biogenesis protein FliO